MSACRSCGAPVRWVVNEKTGKRTPLDPKAPLMRRGTRFRIIGVNADGSDVVRSCTGTEEGFVSHFATCPDSKSWRR